TFPYSLGDFVGCDLERQTVQVAKIDRVRDPVVFEMKRDPARLQFLLRLLVFAATGAKSEMQHRTAGRTRLWSSFAREKRERGRAQTDECRNAAPLSGMQSVEPENIAIPLDRLIEIRNRQGNVINPFEFHNAKKIVLRRDRVKNRWPCRFRRLQIAANFSAC